MDAVLRLCNMARAETPHPALGGPSVRPVTGGTSVACLDHAEPISEDGHGSTDRDTLLGSDADVMRSR
jgi:hypothetical protein